MKKEYYKRQGDSVCADCLVSLASGDCPVWQLISSLSSSYRVRGPPGKAAGFPQHFHVSADITHTQRGTQLIRCPPLRTFIYKKWGEKEGKSKSEWKEGKKREEGKQRQYFLKDFLWWFSSEQKSFNLCVSLSLSPSLSFLLFYLFMSCAIERLLTRPPPSHTRHVSSLHVLVILITFNVPCVSRRDSFVSHQKCDLCTPRRMRNIFWLNKNQTTQQPWPVFLCARPKAL